jgi:hypothetical protein
LNADVSLFRQLDDSNMDANGHVSCAFKSGLGATPCPVAASISIAEEYLDNDTWMVRVAWSKETNPRNSLSYRPSSPVYLVD